MRLLRKAIPKAYSAVRRDFSSVMTLRDSTTSGTTSCSRPEYSPGEREREREREREKEEKEKRNEVVSFREEKDRERRNKKKEKRRETTTLRCSP